MAAKRTFAAVQGGTPDTTTLWQKVIGIVVVLSLVFSLNPAAGLVSLAYADEPSDDGSADAAVVQTDENALPDEAVAGEPAPVAAGQNETVEPDQQAVVESDASDAGFQSPIFEESTESVDAQFAPALAGTGSEDPAVAKIGETEYPSLAAAVAAVTDSATITMVADEVIEGNAGVTIPAGKAITLDLNGFTVKNLVNENASSQVILNRGTLTIKDSSTEGTGLLVNAVAEGTAAGDWWSTPQYNYATNVITNCGTLNVEAGTIRQTAASSICYAVDNNSNTANATVNISGGLIESNGSTMRLYANGATTTAALNITGGTVKGGYCAFWVQLPGSDSSVAPKVSVDISGGTLEAETYAFYDYSYGNAWTNVDYSITGGTFDSAYGIYSYGVDGFISGGVFQNTVIEDEGETYNSVEYLEGYLAPDYKLVDLGNGYWAVQLPKVAQIGEVTYKSLADAVAAVPTDGTETTITMLSDEAFASNAGIVIPAGKNIVLDLNGKTVSQAAPEGMASYLIENRGTLKVVDGATGGLLTAKANIPDTAYGYGNYTVENFGTFTLESGTVENTTTGAGAYYALDTREGATANINGGKLTSDSITIRQVSFGAAENELNITGGVIEHGFYGVQTYVLSNDMHSHLNISGGTFASANEYASMDVYVCKYYDNLGNVFTNISGGSFANDVGFTAAMPAENITVSGGTFAGDVFSYDDAAQFITGGTFKSLTYEYDDNTYTCDWTHSLADGLAYTYDEALEAYVVVPAVATVEFASGDSTYTVGYATFAEAVQAAGTRTITLLANAGTYYMAPDQTLNVAKNGKSLTVKIVEGEPYTVASSTADGVTTYTAAAAVVEITDAGGKVTYSNTLSSPLKTGTYKLLSDLTFNRASVGSATVSNQSVVIDLNGFTLTSTNTSTSVGAFIFHARSGDSSLTVKNGTFAVTGNCYSAFTVSAGKTLNLESTLTVSSAADAIVVLGSGATVNTAAAVTTTADYAIVGLGSEGNGGTVINVTGGSLTSPEVAIYHPQAGTLNISGGTITGKDAVYMKSGTLTVSGDAYLVGNGAKADYVYTGSGCSATGDALVVDSCGYPGGDPAVSITGGKFESANAAAVGSYAYGESTAAAGFVPADSAALFKGADQSDVAILADGCIFAGPDSAGFYGVGTPVAAIGDVQYASLAYAVAAVPANGVETTITMLADEAINANAGIVIPAGKNIVLDLNGKTVSQVAPEGKASYLIENHGTLKVVDGATGGLLTAKANIPDTAYGYGNYTVENFGTFTLESGTVENTTTGAGAYYALDTREGATANINGGKLTSDSITIRQVSFDAAENELNITGGVIESGYYAVQTYVIANNMHSHLNISGGSFSTTDEEYGLDVYVGAYSTNFDNVFVSITGGNFADNVAFSGSMPAENITVSGGVFDGVYGAYSYNTAAQFITGGYFNPVSSYWERFVVDGMSPTKVASGEYAGYYTLGQTNATYSYTWEGASYTETFCSLAEAVAAVYSDTTDNVVTLLSDETGAGIVTEAGQDITIDFGGHVYTVDTTVGSAGTKTLGAQLNKDSKVTLKNGTFTSANAKMLVQNYADLTLDNVVLDGTQSAAMQYVVSNNCGSMKTVGTNAITAPEGAVAFDVCATDYYPEGVAVTISDGTTVTGKIMYDVWRAIPAENKATLTITGGDFKDVAWVIEDALAEATVSNINVSGGTFSAPVPEDCCAFNYVPVQLSPTTYGVELVSPAMKDLMDRVAALEDAVEALEALEQQEIEGLEGIADDIEALQTSIDGLNTAIAELNGKVATTEQLNAAAEELEGQITAAEAALASALEDSEAALKDYVDDAVEQLQTAIDDLATAEGEDAAAILEQIGAILTNLAAQDDALAAIQTAINGLVTTDHFDAVTDQLSADIAALKTALEGDIADAIAAAEAEMQQYAAGVVADLEAALADLATAEEANAEAIAANADKISDALTALGQLNDVLASIGEEIDGLATTAQLNAATGQLAEAIEGIQSALATDVAAAIAAAEADMKDYADAAVEELQEALEAIAGAEATNAAAIAANAQKAQDILTALAAQDEALAAIQSAIDGLDLEGVAEAIADVQTALEADIAAAIAAAEADMKDYADEAVADLEAALADLATAEGANAEAIAANAAKVETALTKIAELKDILSLMGDTIDGLATTAQLNAATGQLAEAIEGIQSALATDVAAAIAAAEADMKDYADEAVADLEAALADLATAEGANAEAIAANAVKVETALTKIAELKDILSLMGDTIDGLATTAQLNAATADILDAISGIKTDLEGDVADAVAQVKSDMQDITDTAVGKIQAAIDALPQTSDIEAVKNAIDTANGNLAALNEAVGALASASAVEDLAAQIAALPELIDNATNSAITALKEATNEQIAALNTSVTEQIGNLKNDLSTDIAGTTEQVQQLNGKAGEIESKIAALSTLSSENAEALTDKLGMVESNIQTAVTKVYNELQSQAEALGQKIDELKEQGATAADIQQLTNELAQVKEILDGMDGGYATQAQAAQIISQLTEVAGDITGIKNQIANIQTYLERIDATTSDTNKKVSQIIEMLKPVVLKVTDTKAVSSTYSSIKVSWQSATAGNGYEVWGKKSGASEYALLMDTAGTTYTQKSLKTGTKYYYKVRAYMIVDGEKYYGDFTPAVSAAPKLAKVTVTTAKSKAKRQATITVKKVSGAQGYQIKYRQWSSTTFKYTTSTKLTKTLTGLKSGKKYTVSVRAYRVVDGKKVYGAWSVGKFVEVK